MDIQHSTISIADYCAAYDRDEIKINKAYQRSEVWPAAARSFLIETILLGFPVPKLSLHQKTDIQSRRTIKEVVDGQQRTRAIKDFFDDRFRLSPTTEVTDGRGLKYSALPPELQAKFLDYGLNFDVFVGSTEREVREVFRRINSFTVPLNPEEHRHAIYQGPFKWFVHELTGDYGDLLITAGVFRQKQVVRMADAKLITEIVHAYLNGISTTNKRTLDTLYRSRNVEFGEENRVNPALRSALDLVLGWPDIHTTSLMKPYNLYALVLAAMQLDSPTSVLAEETPDVAGFADEDMALVGLGRLADALVADPDDLDADFKPFVNASSEKTNVAAQRAVRFQWCCLALAGELP